MIKNILNSFKGIPLLRKVYNRIKIHITNIFYIIPVNKQKIVFDNFGGRGYGCDPKYIAEELLRQSLKLDLVWLTQDINTVLPNGIRPVKYGTIRAAYELSTAKVWVDNIKNAYRVKKKPAQYYIQTWHSSLGLKKNEKDANLPSEYINRAKLDAEITDLMYSNNQFRADKYRTAFWYHGPVIECGVPRNSILYYPTKQVIDKVQLYFQISSEQKIVLYAPTFRKNTDLNKYKFDYHKCIDVLKRKFDGKFIFLLRLHPNEAKNCNDLEFDNLVKNASNYPDMQELLAVADILITDYSGCMFDFCFAHKPTFLFSKDLENYLKKDRDVYFILDELPFSLAKNEENLFRNIETFTTIKYETECECFCKKIGLNEDGHGAEVIVEIIKKNIKVY